MATLQKWIVCALGRATADAYRLSPPAVRDFMDGVLAEVLKLFLERSARRDIVSQNLTLAFADDEKQKREVRTGFYRHLAKLILEISQHFGDIGAYTKRFTDLEGIEHYHEAMKLGKGVILLSSHVGNWEIMSATGGLVGMDLLIVTKKLKPAWLHDLVEASRLRVGVKAAYEPQTLKSVLRHLGRGEAVGIVLDQYAGPPVGVRVPYFGVAVGTHSVAAVLAKRTGAPVLPVVTSRRADGVFDVRIRAPIKWKSAENPFQELGLNTANYVAKIEEDVRAFPDQWLWTHRRFKGDLSSLRPNEWSDPRDRAGKNENTP